MSGAPHPRVRLPSVLQGRQRLSVPRRGVLHVSTLSSRPKLPVPNLPNLDPYTHPLPTPTGSTLPFPVLKPTPVQSSPTRYLSHHVTSPDSHPVSEHEVTPGSTTTRVGPLARTRRPGRVGPRWKGPVTSSQGEFTPLSSVTSSSLSRGQGPTREDSRGGPRCTGPVPGTGMTVTSTSGGLPGSGS